MYARATRSYTAAARPSLIKTGCLPLQPITGPGRSESIKPSMNTTVAGRIIQLKAPQYKQILMDLWLKMATCSEPSFLMVKTGLWQPFERSFQHSGYLPHSHGMNLLFLNLVISLLNLSHYFSHEFSVCTDIHNWW